MILSLGLSLAKNVMWFPLGTQTTDHDDNDSTTRTMTRSVHDYGTHHLLRVPFYSSLLAAHITQLFTALLMSLTRLLRQ